MLLEALGESRMMKVVALGLCAASVAVTAHAAEENIYCRNGLFPREQIDMLGLARVVAPKGSHFNDESGPECKSDARNCSDRGLVRNNLIVITGRSLGGFVCAYFPRTGSAGWLPASALQPIDSDLAPPLKAWTGRWRFGDNDIRLAERSGKLAADGRAYWPSEYPSLKDAPGGPHSGEMSGLARPSGSSVAYEDTEGCSVRMKLVGRYLVATDNGACGGANVRFDGVYQRK